MPPTLRAAGIVDVTAGEGVTIIEPANVYRCTLGDGVFVGPSDLAASMGMLGDVGHAAVQDQLKQAARMCREAGTPCGIIGGTPELVGRYVDYGYTWIAIGSDMSFMVGRAQEWLGNARGQAPAAPKAQGGY